MPVESGRSGQDGSTREVRLEMSSIETSGVKTGTTPPHYVSSVCVLDVFWFADDLCIAA